VKLRRRMNKGQKYVVRCVKAVPVSGYGCEKGEYMTEQGRGSRKLSEARVFVQGSDDFWWDDDYDWGCPVDFYEARQVKVVTLLQLDEPPKKNE